MSDERAIGVFDSGLGGLTVVKELFRLLPNESIVYLGDTARCPYGGRSEETIRRFGLQDASYLQSQNIKLLIVACNTVSSVALEYIREKIQDIPVIGVVGPGSKAATNCSVKKKIGVIGTAATVRADAYAKTIAQMDDSMTVFSKACPLFVPLVEEGLGSSEIARLTARHYLDELISVGIDCLILGCTHYPLLFSTIQETVGQSIHLVDSAYWTVMEAQNILKKRNALAEEACSGADRSRLIVTDFTPNFESAASQFLGRNMTAIEKIDLETLVRI